MTIGTSCMFCATVLLMAGCAFGDSPPPSELNALIKRLDSDCVALLAPWPEGRFLFQVHVDDRRLNLEEEHSVLVLYNDWNNLQIRELDSRDEVNDAELAPCPTGRRIWDTILPDSTIRSYSQQGLADPNGCALVHQVRKYHVPLFNSEEARRDLRARPSVIQGGAPFRRGAGNGYRTGQSAVTVSAVGTVDVLHRPAQPTIQFDRVREEGGVLVLTHRVSLMKGTSGATTMEMVDGRTPAARTIGLVNEWVYGSYVSMPRCHPIPRDVTHSVFEIPAASINEVLSSGNVLQLLSDIGTGAVTTTSIRTTTTRLVDYDLGAVLISNPASTLVEGDIVKVVEMTDMSPVAKEKRVLEHYEYGAGGKKLKLDD